MKRQGKIYQISEKELARIRKQGKLEGVQKALILSASWLMEEPEFHFSEDRICEMWDGISYYAQSMDKHLISLKKVCEIIKEHTGLEIHLEDL